MKVHRYLLPLVLIASLLGSVLIAKATGYWSTSGRAKITRDVSGVADPEDIKGWMTLADVSEIYGIPEAELRSRLNLPADLPADTALKDIEALVSGFEVSAVRDAVAAYRAGLSGVAPEPQPTAAPEQPTETASGTPVSGALSTDEIKGKNTLAEVASMYGIPVEQIVAEAGLPADVDVKAPLKDIAAKYGIEILNIREAVERILAGR
ncbi:MAG: hypothetical protein QHH80_12595 [Anaerolineae bacterium]|jgi:hypothetical protein|nr:hypothetical protein [Anaerolineae bacterium]